MYGVIRRYGGSRALQEALVRGEQEVRGLLSSVPGCVAYYAVHSGNELATITICDDQAGTQESTRRAANWVQQQQITGMSAPAVTEGEVILNFGG